MGVAGTWMTAVRTKRIADDFTKTMTLDQKSRANLGSGNPEISAFDRLHHSRIQCQRPPKTFRQRLHSSLNMPIAQIIIVVVVTLDLLLIASLVLIDWSVIQDPSSNSKLHSPLATNNKTTTQSDSTETLENVEDILHTTQIAILSAFLFEIFLRVFAHGFDMLDDRWQIFDCLVVMVTFALYVSLSLLVILRTITYPAAFVISLRLWRAVRVYTALVSRVKKNGKRALQTQAEVCRRAEKELSAAQVTIVHQQKEIESLRVQLKKVDMTSQRLSERRAQLARMHAYYSTGDFYYSEEDLNSSRPVASSAASMERSRQHVYTPSGVGVVFGARTPRGSTGSLVLPAVATTVTPAAPLSAQQSVTSVSSSIGKFPDIVEHTQSCHDMSSLSVPDPLMVSIVAQELATRECQQSCRSDGDDDGSDKTLDNGAAVNSDFEKLLPCEMRRETSGSFLNAAFSGGLSDEEREIRRVSQVPFPEYDSQTPKEHIPMTDL